MSNNFFRSIEKKIKQTDNEILEIKESNLDKEVKEFVLSQLNNKINELKIEKKRMDDLYGKEQLKLVLSGENIGKGEVPIRILADTLSNIQNLIDCIASSLRNQTNKNKRITNETKESTQFVLKEVFEGSFGMIIEAPFDPDMINNENVTTCTCKKMFDLLSCSDDEESLKLIANDLGYKTMNSYKQLLKKIQNSNSNINFEWDSNSGEKNIWKSDSYHLKETINKINTIQIEQEELIQKIGKLTKIDIVKEEFTVICKDEVLNGKCNFEILMGMHSFLDKEKEFYFTKKIFKHINTGKEKIEWILTGVNRES